jgi:plasmid replication initiation protein
MKEIVIAQDNRLTTSRYELTLVEKRIFYYIIKEVRNKYTNGQRDLFDDLILNIKVSDLCKEVNQEDNKKETRKALEKFRSRNFTYANEDEDDWLTCGFINYAHIKKGVAEIQVSHKLMPFLVELSSQYTTYSLHVAMSLKSKWSQRMYELCQKWQGTDGFRISVDELRQAFMLEDKYNRYALLNERVLQVAKRELKELYDLGQCDVYFEFTEERKGRTVEMLRFKLFRKNTLNVKTTNDLLLELIPLFQSMYETTTKPKNDTFIKNVVMQLQKYPNLIEPLNKRIKEILAEGMKNDTPRYIRFILNEDVIAYNPKANKTKKAAAKPAAKKEEEPDPMEEILKLSKILSNDK